VGTESVVSGRCYRWETIEEENVLQDNADDMSHIEGVVMHVCARDGSSDAATMSHVDPRTAEGVVMHVYARGGSSDVGGP
jgi:hypothetical protein